MLTWLDDSSSLPEYAACVSSCTYYLNCEKWKSVIWSAISQSILIWNSSSIFMKAVASLALKPCRTQLSCALLRCSSNPAADPLCSWGAQADTWETPAGGCIWVAFRTHGMTSRLRVGFPVQHFTSWSWRIVQTGSKRTWILAPPDFKTLLSRALIELQHMSFPFKSQLPRTATSRGSFLA
jgi:hypothetical protein